LTRDAKDTKKGFYRYVSQKRKVRQSVLPVMSKTCKLVTTGEKAEVLNNIFASVFTSNLSSHFSSGWIARQGLVGPSPSHRERRSGL